MNIRSLATKATGSIGVAALMLVNTVHAIDPIGPAGDSAANVGSDPESTIGNIATKIIDIITILAGALAVIYLIWSGIQYITSAGNPDKAKTARTGIINAVIGIVVIVAAYYIIGFAMGLGNIQ